MTTIERFQELQVELVRAGFATNLAAKPKGEEATVGMTVELHDENAAHLEQLERLTSARGFSFTVGKNSRADIELAAEAAHR